MVIYLASFEKWYKLTVFNIGGNKYRLITAIHLLRLIIFHSQRTRTIRLVEVIQVVKKLLLVINIRLIGVGGRSGA